MFFYLKGIQIVKLWIWYQLFNFGNEKTTFVGHFLSYNSGYNIKLVHLKFKYYYVNCWKIIKHFDDYNFHFNVLWWNYLDLKYWF